MSAPRSQRVEVNGWVILDKPVGLTSTQAVSKLKRLFNAKKAGHAGTLDPLASGVLPVAFGEATKTVPFVQDGEKAYRFTVRWGIETDTDDTEGQPTQTSDIRPDRAEIEALLPHFTGEIMQAPPAYSAIKINGERAYDLARDGEKVEIAPRPVTIHSLRLVDGDRDHAVLEAECGKGTYVRAIARDLGRMLGCHGHVVALRRTRVGPFFETESASLAELLETPETAHDDMLSVEAGLTELPCIVLDRNGAARLRRGQSVILRGRDAPAEGPAYAVCGGVPIASGSVEGGEFLPNRVFNLPF
ncbi:tRNA pseudouridine(55) synthase TruB [Rhodoblastus sphagnicola]|uniref:tRNA pseudouridine synthase B n=1 Tax=Rhodoblastus sphagnicola TaxID=333368 RepID=A0A2S6NFH8_9HYPH|nr:tRNA pseudouridine(55) synthase TruB [Rhodoblastus sphagnicola]MBB4199214.1 tRNA pseudouridine55 synthase [Rhodoblastus sphagnicola]PPQ33378.1 tRNA pseudouridine(55) synthase TruB [Rhodoblastus sphagnicola]